MIVAVRFHFFVLLGRVLWNIIFSHFVLVVLVHDIIVKFWDLTYIEEMRVHGTFAHYSSSLTS